MIYFDNAATTWPKPAETAKALSDSVTEPYGNPGRGGHAAAMRAAELVYGARKKAARLFNAAGPQYVCFTGGCTEALNAAVLGAVKPGDKVLTSNAEHNSVIRPLIRSGADVTYFDALSGPGTALEQVRAGLIRGASAVVCTYASNVFPLILPIEDIGALCREYGALFIVDAAQAAGICAADMQKDQIDILCAPAHKGLYGATGCGLMIFSENYDVSRHAPLTVGGSGVDSREPGMPLFTPERFEAGTLPTSAIAALSAGIDFISGYGVDNARKHEEDISRTVLDGLYGDPAVEFYKPAPGSLLSFNLRGKSCEETAALLDRCGVCARAGLHCAPGAHKYTAPDGSGAVRISFSVFNTEDEAREFCGIIRRISRL